jgi:hypothetical protein
MELENLKQLWRRIEVKPVRTEETERLIALLGKRSHGPVAKMRRNLLGELILVIATYIPVILYYFFGSAGKLSEIAWFLLLLLLSFTIYYYRKDRLLKEMLCVSCRVRSNLELQVSSLQKYIRVYALAGTIAVPVIGLLSLAVIYWKLPASPGWKNLLPWATALAPVTIGCYYINTWYVRKVYGRHIRKLKDLLEEMNEEYEK